MKDNNTLIYVIVAVVVVLVFAGAWLAVNMFAPTTYDVSLSLAANNTGPLYPYLSTTFNILVTNNGGKEVVGLPVAFYLNGIERNYSTYAIPAHQSILIVENYTYTSTGPYLFTAAVDPGNVLNLAERNGTRQSRPFQILVPQGADVYESVPNANIVYSDSFSTSGTGLLTGSLMASIYNVSALTGINGAYGSLLLKTYDDLYPYVAATNGAYSSYANGSATYAAWLQGTLSPQQVAYIVSSFNKKVTPVAQGGRTVEYAVLANTISLCSYYQGGWTKIIELYNNSLGGNCLGMTAINHTPSESNTIISTLKSTRLGSILTANQMAASKLISWSHFYYNNATVLGQAVEYQSNEIAASTLFQLQNPQAIFLSRIKKLETNVSAVNATCLGLVASTNGTSVCSVVLPTTGSIGNRTFGAVYSESISSNYTAEVYSLIGQADLTLAHANAAELISRLGINSSSVVWHSPFKSACNLQGGFSCGFKGEGSNGSVELMITNLNYSSIKLDNITCEMGAGFTPMPLGGTLAKGENSTLQTECHTIPIPGFAGQDSYTLRLGFTYKNSPMIVNGTLNVSNSG
jgi:hypothetical protein